MANAYSIPSLETLPFKGIALLGVFAALAGCGGPTAPSRTKNPTPVTIAVAMVGPQALTFNGLGHVQGFDTALVRAQTSGQILSISFTEGQSVHAGQALAQIDPRPLRTALAQDESALARDRAAQANASDILTRSAPLARIFQTQGVHRGSESENILLRQRHRSDAEVFPDADTV